MGVEVGQMHSGCVAKSCKELLPSDSGHVAVGQRAKKGEMTTSRASTQHSCIQPHPGGRAAF